MDQKSNEMEMAMVHLAKPEINDQTEIYKVYKRRYIMASFFAFSTICSSMMFSTCNPIASVLAAVYEIPTFVVSLAANGFLLMHPLLTIVQTFIVNQTDISVSLKIGCALTLLGALIRTATVITERFYTIILGSLVAGMGRPFIINIQANVAKEWFRPEDKTTVMIAFSFIITCSSVFGVIVPGQIFKGYKYETDPDDGKWLTGKLMVIELEIFSAILIPAILFFRPSPPTPPGPINKSRDEFTYLQSLKITAKNKNFILLFICYSLLMGGFHALAVVISYLFNPFGFTPSQTSFIQSSPIICGFVSSVMYSILIRKYHLNHKKIVLFNLIPVLVSLGLSYFALMTESLPLVLLCYSVLGFFVIPCIPLQLELACKVLHPINQTIAVGFLLAGVHIWSFVFGEILSVITHDQNKTQAFYGCLLLFLSFLAAAICFSRVKLPKEDEEEETTQVNQSTQEGI
ncbi:unnamed protein product [Paramecium primaurelia]|uniref:Major facilitator superfamily (MFS) profile domain-containing protein n=2 Tax=Paramecium TaxID=5884 RepID=A0A8S1S2P7_9CILI|nr:unnamed protein product [Paramecium primaurelia]CAD8133630.1 unnamed protein product [Paramecium pentaurelia]